MSAVLDRPAVRLVPYSEALADQVMALAREMHAESVSHRHMPLSEGKLLAQFRASQSNPDVYLRLAVQGLTVLGGVFGMAGATFFSDAKAARDLAVFMSPSRRGGYAVALLLRDFERWAKGRGCVLMFVGQSTGVNVLGTQRLFVSLGFSVVGSNTMKVL